jgi:antitoxin VapB
LAKQFRTRTFKSGNSVALRLPKALGLREGDELQIVGHANGRFSVWRVADDAAMLDGLYGAMSPGFLADGRGETGQDECAWNAADTRSAA